MQLSGVLIVSVNQAVAPGAHPNHGAKKGQKGHDAILNKPNSFGSKLECALRARRLASRFGSELICVHLRSSAVTRNSELGTRN
jgi:hypothetical protein